MTAVEERIYRLSHHQLKALFLLAQSANGVISSTEHSPDIGRQGKALGGVFSSLARQNIANQRLIMPWGRSEAGRGLKWKLNQNLISKDRLLKITEQLLVE